VNRFIEEHRITPVVDREFTFDEALAADSIRNRYHFAQGLSATANIFAERFEKEMRARRLSRKLSSKVRGRALVDLMQGMLLRAKAGVPRKELLEDARSYAAVVLA
jgi:hypothetical protein